MEIITVIILYITFLIAFIIIAFMLLLFGNEKVFNGNDKLRKSVEEFEGFMERTFSEMLNKIIDITDSMITKIRRRKWEN